MGQTLGRWGGRGGFAGEWLRVRAEAAWWKRRRAPSEVSQGPGVGQIGETRAGLEKGQRRPTAPSEGQQAQESAEKQEGGLHDEGCQQRERRRRGWVDQRREDRGEGERKVAGGSTNEAWPQQFGGGTLHERIRETQFFRVRNRILARLVRASFL